MNKIVISEIDSSKLPTTNFPANCLLAENARGPFSAKNGENRISGSLFSWLRIV